jgi:hypothetical protein
MAANFLNWTLSVVGIIVGVWGAWYAYRSYLLSFRTKQEQNIQAICFDLSAETVEQLRELAAQGYAEAQYQLGKMHLVGRYIDGVFVERDDSKGLELIFAAALQGHLLAQQLVKEKGVRSLRTKLEGYWARRHKDVVSRCLDRFRFWSAMGGLCGFLGVFVFAVVIRHVGEALWDRWHNAPIFPLIALTTICGAAAVLIRNYFDIRKHRPNLALKRMRQTAPRRLRRR